MKITKPKYVSIIFIMFMVLCIGGGTSVAQDDFNFGSEDSIFESLAAEGADSDEQTTAQDMDEENSGLVTLDFQDAPLGTVLRVLSDQTGINFIISDNIRERIITIYLSNVSSQDAINSVLKSNGLIFEKVGEGDSEIYIVRLESSPETPLVTETFRLNFLSVKDETIKYNIGKDIMLDSEDDEDDEDDEEVILDGAETIVQRLISDRGSIVGDLRTNTLIVTDIPTKIQLVKEVLETLDQKTPQVMIEAEILETTSNLLKELGLRWGSGANGTMFRIAGSQRRTYFPFGKSLFQKGLQNAGTPAAEFAGAMPNLPDFNSYSDTIDNPLRGIVSFAEFQIALEALERNWKTKVLARPKIMTLNNHPAVIEITAETAIGDVTEVSGGSEGVETRVTRAERSLTGVSLLVIPSINQQGFVTMQINPQVVIPLSSKFFPGVYVDPHKRSAETTVMIKDGETLIIGGLLSTDDLDQVRKVPILGDMPLLGHIFRHKERQKEDKDLVIFITPHVMKDIEPDVVLSGVSPNGANNYQDQSLTTKMIMREQSLGSRDELIAQTVKQIEDKC